MQRDVEGSALKVGAGDVEEVDSTDQGSRDLRAWKRTPKGRVAAGRGVEGGEAVVVVFSSPDRAGDGGGGCGAVVGEVKDLGEEFRGKSEEVEVGLWSEGCLGSGHFGVGQVFVLGVRG